MDILKNKIIECGCLFAISAVLAIALPSWLNAFWLCLIGIALMGIFGFKTYQLYKVKKNNDFFEVHTLCTGIKMDVLNFGVAKKYEFEPLTNKEFKEVINLQLNNDESSSLFKPKMKIRENYGYTLLFKVDKSGKKVTNQQNFIGYKRYVLPE